MMAPECKNPAARVHIRFPWRWVLGLLAAAALAFPAYLYFFRDEPPHDDSDLVIEEQPVPPEKNGWHLLKKATEQVYWPDSPPLNGIRNGQRNYERADQMSAGISWDEKLAEGLLRKNDAGLRQFDDRRRFSAFVRTDGDDYDGDIHFDRLRALINSVCIRAFVLERRGEVEQAFEDAMNVVRLGRKLRRTDESSLLSGATWVEMSGLQVLRALLRRNRACACEFKNYSGELLAGAFGPDDMATDIRRSYASSLIHVRKIEAGSAEPDPDSAYTLLKGMAPRSSAGHAVREALDSMEEKRVPAAWRHRVFFLPNQTRRMDAESARIAIRNAVIPVKDWKPVEMQPHAWEGFGGWLRFLPVRNGIGKFSFGEPHRSGMNSAVNLRVEALLLATWLALECHRQEKGNLPASLDELVPGYFSAVPLDPYDGEPLRYSAERGVIHSVGNDFIDSGGSTRPDWRYTVWDESEPTLRIDE